VTVTIPTSEAVETVTSADPRSELDPWELAADRTRCIGCAGPLSAGRTVLASLWCDECWRTADATGHMPDLLDGGEALRY